MANHKKQFCPKGHDTLLVGRLNGSCRICRKETSKKYYQEFNQKAKASIKKWADGHKEHKKDKVYRRIYGITLEDYWRMHKVQDGRCAICTKRTDLVVDHDHQTGTVRGLLCGSCNRGIGYLKDSSANLSRAVSYLEKLSPALGFRV